MLRYKKLLPEGKQFEIGSIGCYFEDLFFCSQT